MESEKQQKHSSPPSEVAKFYDGKSVFITGAAGFLGSVLLESLLRCCPGIRHIYILIRPKRGVQPEERKENILKKEIFNYLKEKCPDVLNKVIVVAGDITQDNLGISVDDKHKVSQEVSIVFHCAATVSFSKPLGFIVEQNVIGTNNVLEFCKELKKLEVFSYTSTAYSNCNLFNIEEKIYKLPFTAEELIKRYKNGGEKEVMPLFLKCEPKFPNFYTFTKSVSETLIAEKATDFPTFIVRPSIVICCINKPLPGYIEDGTALTIVSLGIGKGFIRLLPCDPEKKTNQIPVDCVANTHIVGAYRQIVDKLPSPSIYNCVGKEQGSWTWKAYTFFLQELVSKNPLPNTFQKPSLILCKNRVKYMILSMLDHYGPAFVIDSLLWISGRKPRLIKLYQFYEQSMDTARYFMMNEWNFSTGNFDSLTEKLNETDKKLLPVSFNKEFNFERFGSILVSGAPMYQKDYGPYVVTSKYVPLYLTSFIKWSFVGGLASAFYMILF